MKDYPRYFYLSLFAIYLGLAVFKINFGCDGGRLLRIIGIGLAVVSAGFLSKQIWDSNSTNGISRLCKSFGTFVALPLFINYFGMLITFNNPGIGVE